MQPPRLLPGLKHALQAMQNSRYSMDKSAHDHLVNEIQNRNIKRKIRSMNQQIAGVTMTNHDGQLIQSQLTSLEMGSSWLACLYVLCQTQTHPATSHDQHATKNHGGVLVQFVHNPHERMFVAQILLQRLQRINICEAIDIEMEVNSASVEAELIHNMQHLSELYGGHLQSCCPTVSSNLFDGRTFPNTAEESVKVEMTIIVLAAIACIESANPGPLYQTLVLALATAVFRFRYTVLSSASSCSSLQQQQQQQETNPLPSIISILQHVFTDYKLHNDAVLWHTISVLPDAILGSPGGARGRLSVDVRSIQLASQDLRTVDTPLLLHAPSHLLGETCAKWVLFLPLTIPILDRILQEQDQQRPHAALSEAFWLALFESASCTTEQIVCSMLGLTDLQPRTGSRSKKRHQNAVNDASSPEVWDRAQSELHRRGELACYAAPHYASSNAQVIAACANACLPHLLRNGTALDPTLFRDIAAVFCQTLCSSNDRSVRALALEPLYSLYTTAALDTPQRYDGSFLAEHFASCALRMAEKCGYPDGYFDRLDIESDHDLEVERNDVRDLIRTVSCSSDGGSTSKVETLGCPSVFSMLVLQNMLRQLGTDNETSLHAFSALAKAANHVARYCSQGHVSDIISQEVLAATMEYMIHVNKVVLNAFVGNMPPQNLLPLSRIASIMVRRQPFHQDL
jgi:hypothetical protein